MNDPTQRLPDHLAKLLPVDHRKALQHPSRRQILRELLDGGQKRSLSDLTREGPVPCPMSCTNYHVDFLRQVELVRQVKSEPVAGSIRRYFSATVPQPGSVLVVLQATRQADHHHLGLPIS
jgi:DNA-binding transcriptional ArsR family regulator